MSSAFLFHTHLGLREPVNIKAVEPKSYVATSEASGARPAGGLPAPATWAAEEAGMPSVL